MNRQEPQASTDNIIESLEACPHSAISLVELDSDKDDTDSHDEDFEESSPRPQALNAP